MSVACIHRWTSTLTPFFLNVSLDLSKAFDCLPHDVLIAKLYAYDCDLPSLKLPNCYLRNRRQRVKIKNFYSLWTEILFGVFIRIYPRSYTF